MTVTAKSIFDFPLSAVKCLDISYHEAEYGKKRL